MKSLFNGLVIFFFMIFFAPIVFGADIEGKWRKFGCYKDTNIGFMEIFKSGDIQSGDFQSVGYDVKVIPGDFNVTIELTLGNLHGEASVKQSEVWGKYQTIGDDRIKFSFVKPGYSRQENSIWTFRKMGQDILVLISLNGKEVVYQRWTKEDEERRLAYALYAEKRYPEAMTYFKKIASKDMSAKEIFLSYCYKMGCFYEAIGFLESLSRKTEKDYEALGAFYALQKNMEKAIISYQSAGSARGDFCLAWIFSVYPQFLDGEKAFSYISKYLPGIANLKGMPDKYNIAAAVFARMGDYQKAQEYHKKSIEHVSLKERTIEALYARSRPYDLGLDLGKEDELFKAEEQAKKIFNDRGRFIRGYSSVEIYEGAVNTIKMIYFKNIQGKVFLKKKTEEEFKAEREKYAASGWNMYYGVWIFDKIQKEYVVIHFSDLKEAREFLGELSESYSAWAKKVKILMKEKDVYFQEI